MGLEPTRAQCSTDFKSVSSSDLDMPAYFIALNAGSEIRTRKGLCPADFKSAMYSVPSCQPNL